MLDNSLVETYAGLEGRDLIKSVLRNHVGKTALVSSFGAESAVLLHMVSEIDPHLPVIFLDTGKLFQETLDYRDKLIVELGLTNVRSVQPAREDLEAFDSDGYLHLLDTDTCCNIRKTIPLEKALTGFEVVISGRKRFHGAARADLDFISIADGRLKIEPLAGFTALDIHAYLVSHHLPSHPLKLEGYRSIGCEPCTKRGGTDEDPRAGRWSGTGKTECGIHFTANGQIIRTVQRQTVNA